MSQPSLLELKQIFLEELKKSRSTKPHGAFYSKRLAESIDYALFLPGKRIRPLMVLSMALANRGATSVGRALRLAMPAALAVEYVHTYSLIHDDLPAMDDDDYRRGRLSLHRRFDEGLAILAGDALLSDAFFLIASSHYHGARLCGELAGTAGSFGLCAGQAEDLLALSQKTEISAWHAINEAKTARLFQCAASVGTQSVDADESVVKQSRLFGRSFGLAFQIKDDIDDNAGLSAEISTHHLMQALATNLDMAETIARSMPYHHSLLELLQLLRIP